MSLKHVEKISNPEHIQLLLAVGETGNFTRAANRLGVSQPAVSQQVHRLEKFVGRQLFHRRKRGVELTMDGEALLAYAKAVFSLTNDLRRQLAANVDGNAITIGITEDFCRSTLPRVLRLFLLEHPMTQIRVRTGRYDALERELHDGTLDLAILRRHRGLEPGRTLWVEQSVWVGHLDPGLSASDPLPLVLPVGPNPARDVVIETLGLAKRTWRIAVEAHSLTGVEAALQAGFGVFPKPRGMPMHDVESIGPDHALPEMPSIEYVLVIPPDRMKTEAERVFVQIVETVAGQGFR